MHSCSPEPTSLASVLSSSSTIIILILPVSSGKKHQHPLYSFYIATNNSPMPAHLSWVTMTLRKMRFSLALNTFFLCHLIELHKKIIKINKWNDKYIFIWKLHDHDDKLHHRLMVIVFMSRDTYIHSNYSCLNTQV